MRACAMEEAPRRILKLGIPAGSLQKATMELFSRASTAEL